MALTRDLVYNQYGDHDPLGLAYVLAQDEQAVRAGTKKAEPLVLRANAGDCVKVTLRNTLTAAYGKNYNGVDGDPALVLEPILGTKMGTRVSLHPQLLRHDVRLSDGAAVGFNPDSTAGPGQTVAYEWYADTELGATNLLDHGDVRGHRQHGLAAALVVEPKGSSYHDPASGAELGSGVTADIRIPGEEDFRETTLVYQDGLNLRTTTGAQVPDKDLPDIGADGLPGVRGGARRWGHPCRGHRGRRGEGCQLHQRPPAPSTRRRAGGAEDRREQCRLGLGVLLGRPRRPVDAHHPGLRRGPAQGEGAGRQPPTPDGYQLDGASWRQEPYDTESPIVGAGRHRHRQGRQRPRPPRRDR